MIENRPIVAMAIGYITGIIMGLYCKISIVFLYLIIGCIYSILKKPKNTKFKLISFKRYFRYVKLVITKKVFVLILVFSIISNSIILYQNSKYQNIQDSLSGKKIQVQATILSNIKSKKYKDVYKVKITRVTGLEGAALGGSKVYLNIKKTEKANLQYGDKIKVEGIFYRPETRRNYRGFDYKEYLKTLGICGTIEAENVAKYRNENSQNILKKINDLFCDIKKLLRSNFKENISNVLLGVLLGYTDDIDEKIKSDFSDSNISHILAVSGMHISYIILFCRFTFEKLLGKRSSNIISIIILIFYMLLTGSSPSVVRATVMAILAIFSKIIYRKSDVWTNVSLSILILLIYNPFLISNISFILSYIGTIGLMIYSQNFIIKNKYLKSIGMVIAIAILIAPAISVYFKQIPVLNLLISMIVGIIVAPIIILGFSFIIFSYVSKLVKINLLMKIVNVIKVILSLSTKLLLKLANFGASIPLNKIYVIIPDMVKILIYYIIIFTLLFIFSVYKPKRYYNRAFNQRIKNLINLLKYRYNQNKNRVLSIIIAVVFIFSIVKIIPKNLKIYFIDVGQGDSSLIITPTDKKILIDGGGSEVENYDVGKNILLPYLLSRGIKSLDYIMISHFDADHAQGCAKIIENMKVSAVILSEQVEENDIYKQIVSMSKKKKIKLIYVKAGNVLNIDGMKLTILHPQKALMTKNVMNNNSIVCKIEYQSFSMLFTGDIEKEAEELILSKEIDLKADVLKVAHHRIKDLNNNEFFKSSFS